jgi:para-aminobenzoate synthetase component 1
MALYFSNADNSTLLHIPDCSEWNTYLENQSTIKLALIPYDLKNRFEKLYSNNYDGIKWDQELSIVELQKKERITFDNTASTTLRFLRTRENKDSYIHKINTLKKHIQQGDIYEVNFCIEFFAENIIINPFNLYENLIRLSPMPFSCFIKHNNKYLICASPERFLKKVSKQLLSQPIKGTIKRGKNTTEDNALIQELKNSPKEKSENVMIVDLVRNDLSRIAEKGSVKVDELCGIYSFPQWHQMISSISCSIKDNIGFDEILKATFPMGSMTGAPKIRAMQLIEEYEASKRGMYSGSVGIILPNNDFDLNVVIRSIQYNSENNYLSFMVGSAITIHSNAEKEYEECLLKAKAILSVLGNPEIVN